ncbi:hypothetical protein [Neolewinella agarilytica]|uniref:Lipoprotein n=1 Tax=Neolewinella agarilytica TaxID=478744 RepID=A0A1H9MC98_9BACT|nr:hypothetical protein [Neolewinella agarilytica]SER21318.1 hypothetical protein SAMN05444359_12845 [Neolewinella agarilytica]
MILLKSRIQTVLLSLLPCLMLIGCDGCDEDIITPRGEECYNVCKGVAECQNGYCECPNQEAQLAPGFCIQNSEAINFISYDQYPGLMDTLIMSLLEEPFDLTWQNGDPRLKDGAGKMYNRDPDALSIGSSQSVITYVFPGDFTTPVDSVWIYDLFDKSNNQYSFRAGEWHCRGKTFVGRFVDRNTIKGEIFLNLCSTNGSTPMPIEIQPETRYPVTFKRWQGS